VQAPGSGAGRVRAPSFAHLHPATSDGKFLRSAQGFSGCSRRLLGWRPAETKAQHLPPHHHSKCAPKIDPCRPPSPSVPTWPSHRALRVTTSDQGAVPALMAEVFQVPAGMVSRKCNALLGGTDESKMRPFPIGSVTLPSNSTLLLFSVYYEISAKWTFYFFFRKKYPTALRRMHFQTLIVKKTLQVKRFSDMLNLNC
jgi:hypothetical protein